MSDDGPKLVHEQSEAEIEAARKEREERDAERKRQDVEWALRRLTSNLLRIVRGAGKPYEVLDEVASLAEALAALGPRNGYAAGETVVGALDIWRDTPEAETLDIIVSGALQIAASRLAGQRTQETAGRRELQDGIRYRQEAIEERRRAEAEALRADKKKPRGGR